MALQDSLHEASILPVKKGLRRGWAPAGLTVKAPVCRTLDPALESNQCLKKLSNHAGHQEALLMNTSHTGDEAWIPKGSHPTLETQDRGRGQIVENYTVGLEAFLCVDIFDTTKFSKSTVPFTGTGFLSVTITNKGFR